MSTIINVKNQYVINGALKIKHGEMYVLETEQFLSNTARTHLIAEFQHRTKAFCIVLDGGIKISKESTYD